MLYKVRTLVCTPKERERHTHTGHCAAYRGSMDLRGSFPMLDVVSTTHSAALEAWKQDYLSRQSRAVNTLYHTVKWDGKHR